MQSHFPHRARTAIASAPTALRLGHLFRPPRFTALSAQPSRYPWILRSPVAYAPARHRPEISGYLCDPALRNLFGLIKSFIWGPVMGSIGSYYTNVTCCLAGGTKRNRKLQFFLLGSDATGLSHHMENHETCGRHSGSRAGPSLGIEMFQGRMMG